MLPKFQASDEVWCNSSEPASSSRRVRRRNDLRKKLFFAKVS
ncbi:MAG: hypothetical protein O3A13_08595 [Proteobacteria bacterium]|nr:hypothetical protein [Pseudomonadota bacterium]